MAWHSVSQLPGRQCTTAGRSFPHEYRRGRFAGGDSARRAAGSATCRFRRFPIAAAAAPGICSIQRLWRRHAGDWLRRLCLGRGPAAARLGNHRPLDHRRLSPVLSGYEKLIRTGVLDAQATTTARLDSRSARPGRAPHGQGADLVADGQLSGLVHPGAEHAELVSPRPVAGRRQLHAGARTPSSPPYRWKQ